MIATPSQVSSILALSGPMSVQTGGQKFTLLSDSAAWLARVVAQWSNNSRSETGAAFHGRNMFQSDPEFTYFASPVTNPFFFEDPRSLTEVRPIWRLGLMRWSRRRWTSRTWGW